MNPHEFYQDVEDRARRLARANGENPDGVNWEGDPSVPYGTRSWPVWWEYADQAHAELIAEEEAEMRRRDMEKEMRDATRD